MEREGLEQLTMREFATAADVSVRTIYNLFADRNGLITALVLESFEEVEEAGCAVGGNDERLSSPRRFSS